MPDRLSAPLTLTDAATFAVVEQDTVEELRSNVFVIVSFPEGSRIEDPDFGIEDPELADLPLDVGDVEDAIAAYEPRALVEVSEAAYNPDDPLASRLRIGVAMPEGEDT